MTLAESWQRHAVKVLSEDSETVRIGGYLVVWGDASSPDLHGEFFTKGTEFNLDWFDKRPLLFHHGLDNSVKATAAGVIDLLRPDDTGLWMEAQIRKARKYMDKVVELIHKGVIGTSSGSLPHLVEVAKTGEILKWPIVEGSLTPTPAEPKLFGSVGVIKSVCGGLTYQVSVPLTVKAITEANEVELDGLLERLSAIKGEGGNESGSQAESSTAEADIPEQEIVSDGGTNSMTLKSEKAANATPVDMSQLETALGSLLAKREEEARIKGLEEENEVLKGKLEAADELQAQIDSMKAQLEAAQAETENEPARRLPGRKDEGDTDPKAKPQVKVLSPFDDLSALDLAHGYVMMRSGKGFTGVSEQYANALADKIVATGLIAAKANELSHSTQTGYGDEWVPDLWSSELWRQARLENVIAPLMRVVEMPSEPYELPVEGADPTVYYVSETTAESQLTLAGSGSAIPDSKVGSSKVTLSAKKFALRVGFSAELTEDSIIPVLGMYREQALRAMADTIDYVILNGDTETGATGNINSDDSAPTTGDRYLAFNGLRKTPLVTTTANGADNSGAAPTLSALRSVRFLMAGKYSVNPRNLAWIVDAGTYGKLLNMDEFITMDKAGSAATAMTGQIGMVDGAPIFVSAEMGLTESDGKISATASNNTLGQAVCIYRPGWVVGYRRRVAASVDWLPYYDSYQMTMTVRLALAQLDTDVASALYNIGV